MVWYRKYQLRYIIALWSQWWKKMCVSSRSPHLFFGKLFYWRATSLSLARLDSSRRKLTRWAPRNSCQMFQKLCIPLVCTQKKKDTFRTVFQNILFISQFMNCFITARGKSKLKQPAYRSMNSNLINKEFVNSFFPVNLRRSQCFVTAEDRHLYNVMKLLKSLHFR